MVNLGVQLAIFLVCWPMLNETARIVCLVIALVDLLGGFAYGPRWPVALWRRTP